MLPSVPPAVTCWARWIWTAARVALELREGDRDGRCSLEGLCEGHLAAHRVHLSGFNPPLVYRIQITLRRWGQVAATDFGYDLHRGTRIKIRIPSR